MRRRQKRKVDAYQAEAKRLLEVSRDERLSVFDRARAHRRAGIMLDKAAKLLGTRRVG